MNKPFTYRSSTQQLLDNAQRDFLMATEQYPMVTVAEMTKGRAKAYSKRLYRFLDKCIANGTEDFFIEVHRWHEVADRCITRYRLRQMLMLPSPAPGRAYYKYDRNKGSFVNLWDLPPKRACEWVLRNKYTAALDTPDAFKTIMDWQDGTLSRRVTELNEQVIKKARKQ